MMDYHSQTKKYALTLGLTPGILWLIGGIVGTYFYSGSPMLYLSAVITGGLPIITTLIASRFNIAGSLFLIVEALIIMLLIYSEGINYIIIGAIFLSYSLPLIISAITFIRYWYKGKTRI